MIKYNLNKGLGMFNWFKKVFSKRINVLSYFPSPAVIISTEGFILFANHSAESLLETNILYNKLITDFLNLPLEAFVSEEDSGFLAAPVKLINQNKYVMVNVNKLPHKDKFIVSLQDVTKQHVVVEKIINNQAHEFAVSDNKNVFLVKMANSITSPIHSVIGFSQAILEGLGGEINEKQEKYLKIIHKNSAELLLLLEKIINLSQIEADLYEYNYKNFDIVNALNAVAGEFRPRIEAKRLQFLIDTEGVSKKTCLSDENVFKIIASNLIENAILSCDLGSITIKLTNPDLEQLEKRGFSLSENQDESSFMLLEVTDTGDGIQDTEIETIFDPYLEVNKSSKKNVLKSLILKITKEFVKHLNGDIWVESELLKQSSYKVIFPVEKVL